MVVQDSRARFVCFVPLYSEMRKPLMIPRQTLEASRVPTILEDARASLFVLRSHYRDARDREAFHGLNENIFYLYLN